MDCQILFYVALREQQSRWSCRNNRPIKFTFMFPCCIIFISQFVYFALYISTVLIYALSKHKHTHSYAFTWYFFMDFFVSLNIEALLVTCHDRCVVFVFLVSPQPRSRSVTEAAGRNQEGVLYRRFMMVIRSVHPPSSLFTFYCSLILWLIVIYEHNDWWTDSDNVSCVPLPPKLE